MVKRVYSLGLVPDIPEGCTWKRIPHGLDTPTPDPSSPECIVEFSTKGDRLAEFESHEGILDIFEYGEI
jgi:hypothetical protein